MLFGYYYDIFYLLVIAAMIFAFAMQANIKSTFRKYNNVPTMRNVPAHVIARQILDSYGLYDVTVMRVDGHLTDRYDPRTNTVSLSEPTFFSSSVAAIGVAAHEVGHAVQYNKGYSPIRLRAFFVPIAQIGSSAWAFIFILGLIAEIPILQNIGIALFFFVLLFQFITLPVEFDASRRAVNVMRDQFLLGADELQGAKKVLFAAAMTYVASFLVTLLQFIRLILLSGRRRR
ncbi:MAG: zinc metallopeptidase [Oscillospiraceae bacterium]|nr:zinc metallopeptidase [Oscillospiraceae bacterium]